MKHILTILILGVALGLPARPGRAAELQLRAECRVRGPVVTLGDVAEIFSRDAAERARLAAIELFPAPAGGQRFLRLREIQDLLLMRGVNLAEQQFSGAAQTAVLSGSPAADQTRALAPTAVKAAQRQAADAIAGYLREQVSGSETWRAEVALDPRQARQLATAGGAIAVRGGAAPWTGVQHFQLTVTTADGRVEIPVDARVALPQAVVVATRAIARGTTIGPTDVELQRAEGGEAPGALHSLEEIVGKEAGQTIAAGKMLDRGMVRAPLAVRRGEIVTVYARTSGIRVKTIARARDEGSVGDLIAVESLQDRKPYYARVCDVQEVEVYARPMHCEEAAASDFSGFAARPLEESVMRR
jgi:flagella basal body P-ring formation protein FlgA